MPHTIVTYSTCPVCHSPEVYTRMRATDFTVSQQSFEIWECNNCGLRFTQDVPNEDQIGKFYKSSDYISHSNSGKGIINKLYLIVRNHTLKTKQKLIEQHTGKTTGNFLDVGAGTGAFANVMRQSGWRVTGLEPDEQARHLAQQLHQVTLQPIADLFTLPGNNYDAITLWHVLEHVHNLHGYMDQLRILLNSGGRLFIAVPNYMSYDASVYRQYWAAYDVPRHLYHFSPKSMKQLLDMHQLKLLAIKPMWFDSFYVSLLSEKYKRGSLGLLKGFLNGAFSNQKAMTNKERCSSLIYVIAR